MQVTLSLYTSNLAYNLPDRRRHCQLTFFFFFHSDLGWQIANCTAYGWPINTGSSPTQSLMICAGHSIFGSFKFSPQFTRQAAPLPQEICRMSMINYTKVTKWKYSSDVIILYILYDPLRAIVCIISLTLALTLVQLVCTSSWASTSAPPDRWKVMIHLHHMDNKIAQFWTPIAPSVGQISEFWIEEIFPHPLWSFALFQISKIFNRFPGGHAAKIIQKSKWINKYLNENQ